MQWQITGAGPLEKFTGTYSSEEVSRVLAAAQEEATSLYDFDNLLWGHGENTGILSGGQILAYLQRPYGSKNLS